MIPGQYMYGARSLIETTETSVFHRRLNHRPGWFELAFQLIIAVAGQEGVSCLGVTCGERTSSLVKYIKQSNIITPLTRNLCRHGTNYKCLLSRATIFSPHCSAGNAMMSSPSIPSSHSTGSPVHLTLLESDRMPNLQASSSPPWLN